MYDILCCMAPASPYPTKQQNKAMDIQQAKENNSIYMLHYCTDILLIWPKQHTNNGQSEGWNRTNRMCKRGNMGWNGMEYGNKHILSLMLHITHRIEHPENVE